MQIATFALTMAAGQLTPGPDMLLILKNTLNHNLRTGMATIAGICLGLILHVVLVFTGLAALLASSPAWFRSVQILGAGYLLWIASKLFRSLRHATSAGVPDGASPTRSTAVPLSNAFREGFLTNVSNVKVLVLFSSILAPLATGPDGLEWIYGAIILLEAALIWPAFAWLMQRPAIRTAFFRYQRAFNLSFAVLIAAFALRLLLNP